jgi:type II secretory pathway pseudopilin PulG
VRVKKGFSLIEIIIILGVVGIMVSGILPLFLNVIAANNSARYYSYAYKVADSKIEEYRNTTFENIEDETFPVSELPLGQGDLTVSNEIGGSPQDNIKELDLTISWNYKKAQEIRIVTYVTTGGL